MHALLLLVSYVMCLYVAIPHKYIWIASGIRLFVVSLHNVGLHVILFLAQALGRNVSLL